MEKFADIIKLFFEKHFLPTLTSIIGTAIIYYITPDNFSFLVKLGKNFYSIFLFSAFMLIIELGMIIYNKISNKKEMLKLEQKHKKNIETENTNFLFDLVDSLSTEDRKFLDYFLENNNEPIILLGYIYNDFLNGYCDINRFEVKDDSTYENNMVTLKKEYLLDKGTEATRYKLKKDLYDGLILLKKKYGKISRF